MNIPDQICHNCQKPKPLTEKFWYRDKSKDSGFATKCRICSKQYMSTEARLARAERKELAALDGEPEELGTFGVACLQEKAARAFNTKPAISIYKDI